MTMQTGPHIMRQRVAFILVAAVWLVIGGRVAKIQVLDHTELHARATNQRIRPVTVRGTRGRILDRNGVELAIEMDAISYGLRTGGHEWTGRDAAALAEAVGMTVADVTGKLTADAPFVWLIRQADADICEHVDALDLPFVERITETGRSYPLGSIGAQVVGYTDIDGMGIQGAEYFLDSELAGREGRSVAYRDARARVMPSLDEPVIAPRNGEDVTLTIDWRIQEIAEEELAAAVEKWGASSGGAIVMDTRTGEILAMANVPVFDPNTVLTSGSGPSEIHKNRMTADMFEPGSTFKVVAFAEALESGDFSEDDIIDCENGEMLVGRHRINDTHEMGEVPLKEVMIHSSNIGTVKIAQELGAKRLYERARLMGFGEKIGFDLPGESAGDLPHPSDWSGLSLPTISYGQGVAVSTLQMCMVYGAIANGGTLIRPNIIRSIGDEKSGTHASRAIRRAMTEETAARLTALLEDVVHEGGGEAAAIDGVSIAGKTGTAQRTTEGQRGYTDGLYISSFIGFIEDRAPHLLCYVLIDSPKGVHFGSYVAAPVFHNIVKRTLNINEPSHENDMIASQTPAARGIKLPDLADRRVSDAIKKLEKLGFAVELVGDSTSVVRQLPLPGAVLTEGSRVTLFSDMRQSAGVNRIDMPDLTGKTMREAVQQLVQANLKVEVNGSGMVTDQHPRAGETVQYGTLCTIACGQ